MKARLALGLLAAVVPIGCAPVNSFSPAGEARFGPSETEIVVLEEPPSRPYIVIGYVECRGQSVKDAMPYLVKQAKANGGEALLKIESTGVFLSLSQYRATVIRYTDGEAHTQTP